MTARDSVRLDSRAASHDIGRLDRITLRFLAVPADVAPGGRSVAAGSVMEWIDKAGYACAVGWSGAYCVTAYVGNVRHTQPIPSGSLVEVQARIVHTGRSSMHVVVTVSSTNVGGGPFTPATTCVLIFVATGDGGRSIAVPRWAPKSNSDHALAAGAQQRIAARTDIKQLMLGQDYSLASAAPRTVLRFLVPPGAVNWGGKAHGGTVMRWLDEAAHACAVGWMGEGTSLEDAVAVYSGGIHFFAPVRIGDLVEIDARLIHTSAHSMHVSLRLFTSDPRIPPRKTLTTVCMSVFVVVGSEGRALPVPPWTPETEGDWLLQSHAAELIGLRKSIPPIPPALALEP